MIYLYSGKCCFSAYFPSNKFRKSNIISIFAIVLVPKSIESWMWWEIFVEKRYLTLCTWLFGIWQFQTNRQESKQQWRSWDCYIRFNRESHYWLFVVRLFIQSAWASALLVLTIRAMPEPRRVGRVTRRFPRFFMCLECDLRESFLGVGDCKGYDE